MVLNFWLDLHVLRNFCWCINSFIFRIKFCTDSNPACGETWSTMTRVLTTVLTENKADTFLSATHFFFHHHHIVNNNNNRLLVSVEEAFRSLYITYSLFTFIFLPSYYQYSPIFQSFSGFCSNCRRTLTQNELTKKTIDPFNLSPYATKTLKPKKFAFFGYCDKY